jgi:hypothetical protein
LFQNTIRTSFGAALTLRLTSLVHPSQAAATSSTTHHPQATPALQLHVPEPMLLAAPPKATSFVRLGCLQGERSRIGVAMAYAPRHFAIGIYDHGDPEVKKMTRASMNAGRVNLMMRGESDSTLVTVRLTDLMRGVLDKCLASEPSTFGDFTEALAGIAERLSSVDMYREMGIEARELQTVTLSVCMPNGGQATEVVVAALANLQ